MVEPQVRKVVTVLFTDVIGSTALGEGLDPETTRAVMARYFAMTRRVIERHGGTVEKFVGDAVMAVFGIPVLHEDDALRAVRAAADMRTGLEALNRELEADLGVTIAVRTGINTGQVVAGAAVAGPAVAGAAASSETLVTGDAVNVAARLEQAAAPGEVLLGEATWRLVRDAVLVGPREAIEARGKSLPLAAYPLVELAPARTAGDRRRAATFVGRERELRRLEQAFEDAVGARRCELFTVLGQAGVGKSRLLLEFLGRIAPRSRIVRGRCLPYGEGITWWPLAEALRDAAGIVDSDSGDEARRKLHEVADVDGSEAADRLASTIGLSRDVVPREEIFWAVRRLFESLARDRPLVLVFEDLHWAEATFLDALENLADLSRNAPMLLIGSARPELLESRPGWAGGKLNATTMLLEPLDEADAGRLIDAIPGGASLPHDLAQRITDAAEGNPLFVQEMIGMLVDEGLLVPAGDGWRVTGSGIDRVAVPPNIQALLAARLDQLDADERTVAGRASVVGRVFEEAAVTALAPEPVRPAVPTALVRLVRKELIVPERSDLTLGDAFKFRHMLIRDAAYESLPKAERADLHEHFAEWLEQVAGDRLMEYEEILGYHLEEAHGYRAGLGLRDERTAELARRAGRWLARAGARARSREDARAARSLLTRATQLLPEDDEAYWPAMLGLGDAVLSTDVTGGMAILDGVIERTREALPAVAAEAALLRLWAGALSRDMDTSEVRGVIARWLWSVRHVPGNEALRADGWRQAGEAAQDEGDTDLAERAYRRAVALARRSGVAKAEIDAQLSLVALGARSEMPVGEAIALAREALGLRGIAGGQRAWGLVQLAFLLACEERFDEGRALIAQSLELRRELGIHWDLGVTPGIVELLAGDPAAAEAAFRQIREDEAARNIRVEDPFVTARIAQAIAFQGRHEEALEVAESAIATSDDDAYTRVFARGTRARALAWLGRLDEALDEGRAVVEWARRARLDRLPLLYGSALEDLATVLFLAGQRDEARSVADDVLERYARKGNRASAARARERFAAVEARAAAPGR